MRHLLSLLVFLSVCLQPAAGQNFVLTAGGGLAMLSGDITGATQPPFGFALRGGFAALSGRCAINRSWGVAGELSLQGHAYDAGKAAHAILARDPLAGSAQVDASGYALLTAAAGPYYELTIIPAFRISLAAMLGVTTVFSPEVTETVTTAPHTKTTYRSGSAAAFYTGAALRPVWYVHPRLGIGLVCAAGFARPELQAGPPYSLAHTTLRTGLEIAFRL